MQIRFNASKLIMTARKATPWLLLFSALPAVMTVNWLFLQFFPANPAQSAPVSLSETLNPANIQVQSLYVYNSRDPNRLFGNFYYTLGTQLAARGQISAADAMLSKAAVLMPKNASVHMNHGVVLEALQKNEDAVAEYRKAIELDPKLVQAHYSLGLLLDQMGQLDEGLKSVQTAYSLDPDNIFINYDLGVLYAKKGDYPNSALYSKNALKGPGSEFAEAYNNYGYALAQMGQFDEALKAVDQSLKLKPDSAATLDSKGYALQGMKRYKDALDAYTEALKIDPTIGEIYLHVGQVQEKLNNYPDSIKAYETYLQLTPDAADKNDVDLKIKELKKKWPAPSAAQK